MHLLVVPENATVGQASAVIDRFPVLRRLNLLYDNQTVGFCAKKGAAVMYDILTQKMHYFDKIE